MRFACVAGWGLSAVLAVGLGAMAYVFMVRGQVEASEDGRTVILLSQGERARILGEMRGMLETVQEIIAAASDDDMEAVRAAATDAGMVRAGGENAALIAKLPLDFKMQGMALHRAFDDLAALAGSADDGRAVQRQLGDMLLACTGCHGGYRLKAAGDGVADVGN